MRNIWSQLDKEVILRVTIFHCESLQFPPGSPAHSGDGSYALTQTKGRSGSKYEHGVVLKHMPGAAKDIALSPLPQPFQKRVVISVKDKK